MKLRTFAVLILTTFLSVTAVAQNYTPNTFTDPVITTLNNTTGEINGGTTISLRSALKAADNLGGTHTITLSTGNYILDGTGTYTYAGPTTVTVRTILLGINSETITINGNGPANTFITMAATGRDRMFLINPDGSTNSPVITFSGITFQNAYLTSDAFGGGAIYSGGGTTESLTLTNCAFVNNTIPAGNGGGAAVKIDPRGNLTVDNCTFTNNVSNDADGGAILFIITSGGLGTGFGTLSVTNSTFTSNSVVFPGAGTSNGGALAVAGQGGVSAFNATITNNTFISNSADGLGGAIVVNNGPNLSTLQINYNRFLGNTGTADAASGAFHFVESSGSVNADNNWWGCNSGPAAGPCERAGGDVAGGGALILTKWLQLKTTASPSPICNSGSNTSTVTASFLSNSASEAVSVANISRLIGLPVTWGPTTNGSLSGSQATIQASGTATSTFTSNGTGGVTATVNAQVDNIPAGETTPSRANITVNRASIAPTGISGTTTICNGSSTILTATGGTLGTGANYQWGTGAVVGTSPLTGQTASTLTVLPTTATTYWVHIENTSAPCSTTPTSGVTQVVTVNQPSVAPSGISGTTTICNGSSTTLTAMGGTLGTGANYQWGTGAVAGTSPIGGATNSTLTVSPTSTTTYWVRIENTVTPCTGNTGGVTQVVTVSQPSVAPTSITGTTTICAPGSTTLTATGGTLGTGANYQWGTGAVVGTSPLVGQTASTLTVSPGSTTTYWVRIENTTAPCTGTTTGVTQLVTVTAANTITLSSTAGTDAQTIPVNTPIINITYTTTGATGATVTGLPAGVTGSWSANVVTISGSPTTLVGSPFNYTVTLTGSCGSVTATGTITVIPSGTIITVTTTTDEIDGNTASIAALILTPGGTGISLREAVIATNNEPVGTTITIIIPAGTYTLTITGNNENGAATGDLDINATAAAGTKIINLVGAGSGTTTITGAVGWDDRLLDLEHISQLGDIIVNISGLTLSGGNVLAGTTSGGAILAGFLNNVTNISNCAFSGNTAPSNGGAISQSSASTFHTLTITNTTFTNNTATGAVGGAVSYTGQGNVTITGCMFSGNTAGTQGGAINISGTTPGPILANITRNTFLNNTANGVTFGGAALGMVQAQTVNMNYNRLFNNNAAGVATGKIITTGGGTVTTMNFDNNWWGVNNGPAASDILGTAPTRWLQLKNIASPSSICNGATSTVTASFLSNNLSEAIAPANLTTVIGQPITFNAPVNGTLSAAQTSIQAAGTATVTFTATAAGTGSANAVFAPATENFTVTSSPTLNIFSNNTITFSSGSVNQTQQVGQAITPTYWNTMGATGATFAGLPPNVTGNWAANVASISGTLVTPGTYNYTITLTGGCNGGSTGGQIIVTPSVGSCAATLSSDPGTNNQTLCINTAITNITYITQSATGIGAVTGLPGGVSANWAAEVLTISGTPTVSGTFNYSIPLTGNNCTTEAVTGTITVNQASVAPTGATGTKTICSGSSTTLTVDGGTKATGATTQWFTVSCGGTSAGTGDAITVSPTTTTTYYVRYSGTCNTTDCATVTVTVNTLSTAPTAATGITTICNGGSTTLTVDGGSKGTGAVTEWFTGSCGGTTAGTGDAITVSPTSTTIYYVRYNGTCNTTTCHGVIVTVRTLSTAPTGATGTTSICPGGSTTLTVDGGSKGTGAVTEWFTGTCGGTPAGTGDVVTVSPTSTTTYYVRYNGICNTTTCATVTVTVNNAPVVTTNPVSQSVVPPNTVTFTAAASGSPTPTVQWQVSTGGPFADIAGETSTTLSFITTAAQNGNQYRAVFTNTCGTATTTAATLTTCTTPVVTTNPTSQAICAGNTVSFTAAASGTPTPTVQWQVSTGGPFTDIPVATSTTLSFTATFGQNGNQYRAVFTNACAPGGVNTTAATLTVNTAPVITCPSNISVNNTPGLCGANVTYPAATATGSPVPSISYSKASGTFFPVGTTTVTATATNICGSVSCSFTVTVVDNEPPVINCPANITLYTGPGRTTCDQTATWTAPTASDNCGATTVQSNYNPGATFTVGTTIINYTATDSHSNISTCSFTVTVVDNTPPVISNCPPNITVYTGPGRTTCDQTATWTAPTASDNCGATTLQSNYSRGATFPVGTTTVRYTATDSHSNTATCSFTVTVIDNTPPIISAVSANPSSLWPPNHTMKDVTINYTSSDNCGGTPACTLFVTSNEPINGTGDGDTAPDWLYVDNHHIKLNAERAGNGNGRIYTITITCTDAAGNSSSTTTQVIVAHNITAPVSGNSFVIGSTINFAGTFWDKPGNTHTAQWLIDNTTVGGTITAEPNGLQNGKAAGSYKFTTAGVYKLQMNIKDQNGVVSYANTNGDLEAIVVIYDPNGGYAYGGGYFMSPQGALSASSTATGKVSYGFNSNYFKTATNPKGETQMEFKVGNLEFNALNFDYLAISNAKAQFKGSGKITGSQAGFNFIMTVIDGAINGTGMDKIRLKIYNKNTGAVIYDNQPGASDAADPTTVVGSGSTITIVNPSATTVSKSITSTSITSDIFDATVMPNPSTDNFRLQVITTGKEQIEVKVVDIMGRQVKQLKAAPYQTILIGSELRRGIYMVEILQGANRKVIKLEKL